MNEAVKAADGGQEIAVADRVGGRFGHAFHQDLLLAVWLFL